MRIVNTLKNFLFSKKRIWLVGVLVIVVAVFVAINRNKDQGEISYSFDLASKGTVEKNISVSGSLSLSEEFLVRSEIGGEIDVIHKSYNDVVKKGDLLVEIFSPEIDEAFEQFSDTYHFAKIDLQNMKELYLTKKKLYAEKLISEKEYSNAKVGYERKLSEFKRTEKQYQEKKEQLAGKKVYAPVDGVVIDASIKERQQIGGGAVLYLLATNLDTMHLTVKVDESEIGSIKKGLKANFSVSAYPDESFTGIVDQVRMTPINVEGIVMYESLLVCKNKDNMLKSGMSANVTIHVAKKENVLRVPSQAFLVSPVEVDADVGEKYVWRKSSISVEGPPVERVDITTGLTGDDFVEITSGKLKEGDEILTGMYRTEK